MREAINDDGRLSTAIRGKSHLSDANPHQWPSTAIPTNLTFQMQTLIIHLFIAHTADHVHTFLFERLTVDPTCGLAQAATVLALLSL